MVLWVKVHHVVFSTFIASPKQSFKSCIIWVSAWWECPLLSLCVSKRVHALQKDPGWSTVMRYEIKRALTFHVLFSLGHALTPVSTRQARLVHVTWAFGLQCESVSNDRFGLQRLKTLSAEACWKKTFTSWHASQTRVATSADCIRSWLTSTSAVSHLNRQHMRRLFVCK